MGHLHEHQIVYRDLKSENVLFNKDGYIKLADFGMATKLEDHKRGYSFCGTAEYLAPEMLSNEGHDKTLDWWTLGVLLYEMLIGLPPFFHKNKNKMYLMIKESDVVFPNEKHEIRISPEARDFIKKLLTKDKTQRLGVHNDIKDILEHDFFKDLNMSDL